MSGGGSTVYVVLRTGANARVSALASLASNDSEIIFVTNGNPDRCPGSTLVVQPYRNPLGLLRRIGLVGTARILDSVVYAHNRHQLYVSKVVKTLRARIQSDLDRGRSVSVLTCVPPHALSLVGRRLKRSLPEIRWVIDWQDLWSSDETYFRRIFAPYRPFMSRLERKLVREADLNVTTNERARRWILSRFNIGNDRATAIEHQLVEPFRNSATGGAEKLRCPQSPRIVFMGRLFKGIKVPGVALLEALRLIRERSSLKPQLHLYGRQGPEFDTYSGREAEFGVEWHGVVERPRVLEELRKYDYLLLVLGDLPNSRLIMHMKLSEYLVAGPPIIAVVPSESAVADIVRRTGTGVVVPAEEDWADGLERALRLGPEDWPRRVPDEIERFSWNQISRRWQRALGLCDRQ